MRHTISPFGVIYVNFITLVMSKAYRIVFVLRAGTFLPYKARLSACSRSSSDNDSSRSKFSSVTTNDESDVTVTESEPTKTDFVNDLADSLLVRRERWALAKAITLAESTNLVKRKEAQRLMSMTLEHLKTTESHKKFKSSFRIGLTGPPGAGKSTFIEAFGKMLTKSGQQVAVLAVDPSSSVSGGSLLGDKTRMPELSRDPKAYIRASPSSGTLGGVTRTTNETILLCEGAGFDIILVETVGVGQSEYVVADMVDVLVLIIPPAGGDELQGIKRGIVERTDIVLVNKADGDLKIPARRVRGEYTSAIKIMRQRSKVWKPKVLQVSSKEGTNLDKTWDLLQEFKSTMITHGLFQAKRRQQQRVWMWSHIQDRMLEAFREDTHISNDIQLWERRVLAGTVTPGMAADALLEKYLPKGKHKHESKFVKSRWMDR
ncbi:putative methylmalonic aciduria type A-like, mitochondrial [Apostichopus japonicus]|uniref:Putative methylmalonic aciduria type A-like, mitochondrial n=1 Tax=Stichopus japonicus TaxID=307972 RepID=A0A2G8L8D5_STIJA|nr:putative methylmalonic aciduria type A-like, mitochondrial [Apostichopus japonicus]